jgi:hypothetical protein
MFLMSVVKRFNLFVFKYLSFKALFVRDFWFWLKRTSLPEEHIINYIFPLLIAIIPHTMGNSKKVDPLLLRFLLCWQTQVPTSPEKHFSAPQGVRRSAIRHQNRRDS